MRLPRTAAATLSHTTAAPASLPVRIAGLSRSCNRGLRKLWCYDCKYLRHPYRILILILLTYRHPPSQSPFVLRIFGLDEEASAAPLLWKSAPLLMYDDISSHFIGSCVEELGTRMSGKRFEVGCQDIWPFLWLVLLTKDDKSVVMNRSGGEREKWVLERSSFSGMWSSGWAIKSDFCKFDVRRRHCQKMATVSLGSLLLLYLRVLWRWHLSALIESDILGR